MAGRKAAFSLVLLGCGLAVSGCVASSYDNASENVRLRLAAVEPQLSSSLEHFDFGTEGRTISSGEDTVLSHSVKGRTVTYEFAVTSSDSKDGWRDNPVSVAACFRVVGGHDGGTIRQISCPKQTVQFDSEVTLVKEERPLHEPIDDGRPHCAALSGGTNTCPGG